MKITAPQNIKAQLFGWFSSTGFIWVLWLCFNYQHVGLVVSFLSLGVWFYFLNVYLWMRYFGMKESANGYRSIMEPPFTVDSFYKDENGIHVKASLKKEE